MRLAVTGGGTGGHVFPALETAAAARAAGWDVRYFGSERGQEGPACHKENIWFKGYASEPVFKAASPAGLRALFRLFLASREAARDLQDFRPDIVFSTGGYSSAPIVQAVKKLGLPYVIHEQNSVPGRTNLLMSKKAKCVCTVFNSAKDRFPGVKVVRTGMPLRKSLRGGGVQGELPFSDGLEDPRPAVLVMGGSQGAAALNDVALATAVRMATANIRWIHLTGVKHFEAAMAAREKLPIAHDYDIRAFLDADGMKWAIGAATLAVSRSGAGSLSELAAFRRPAILVPFPTAYGNHQLHNAREFEEIGAAMVLEQKDLETVSLEGRILSWFNDPDRIKVAQEALAKWDIVDSVPRILDVLSSFRGQPV